MYYSLIPSSRVGKRDDLGMRLYIIPYSSHVTQALTTNFAA